MKEGSEMSAAVKSKEQRRTKEKAKVNKIQGCEQPIKTMSLNGSSDVDTFAFPMSFASSTIRPNRTPIGTSGKGTAVPARQQPPLPNSEIDYVSQTRSSTDQASFVPRVLISSRSLVKAGRVGSE
jgi:hypothetical protein